MAKVRITFLSYTSFHIKTLINHSAHEIVNVGNHKLVFASLERLRKMTLRQKRGMLVSCYQTSKDKRGYVSGMAKSTPDGRRWVRDSSVNW